MPVNRSGITLIWLTTIGVICGFGADSYRLALEGLVHHLKGRAEAAG